MSLMAPFTPTENASATSGAGTSSAATALPRPFVIAAQRVGNGQLRLTSPTGGTQVVAFVKFGGAAVVATLTDLPILPGESFVITPPGDATHFAVIAATATTVYATGGFGE